jgi:hypothetical protein
MLLEVLDIAELSPIPQSSAAAEAPVLREELERALQRFAAAIEAHVRRSFWRSTDNSKKWIEKPERLAQDFLKLVLKTTFGKRVGSTHSGWRRRAGG